MAVHRINRIYTERGDTLEHFGWYGSCTTAAATQAKIVSIAGFSSNSLADGVRVVVRFNYAQTYNGTPTLNVNSTGARAIYTRTSTPAGRYEWSAGQIVPFVYYSGVWYIEDGDHASTSSYGKTILSTSAIDTSSDRAATPSSGLARLNLIASSNVWNGVETVETVFSSTTPAAGDWVTLVDYSFCEHYFTSQEAQDISTALNQYGASMRMLRVTYRGAEFCYWLNIGNNDIYLDSHDATAGIGVELYNTALTIKVAPGEEGAYPVKIELYTGGSAGIMTYPMMESYMKSKGYLTLADLPVYNGGVV